MKEREKTQQVRRKILETAKELFVAQGYQKTTIRQIVERSGIVSGSIYHLFASKEEIFQAEIEELMDRCIDLVNERFPGESGLAKYVAVWMIELQAVAAQPILREIFYQAYSSDSMFEKLLHRHLLLLERFGVAVASKKDASLRVLLLGGAMRAYIASFNFGKPCDAEECRFELLTLVMNAFCASADEQGGIWRALERKDGDMREIAAILLQ